MRSIVVLLVLLDVALSFHADMNDQPGVEKYRAIHVHKDNTSAKAPANVDEIDEAKSDRWSMLASSFTSSGHGERKIGGYRNNMMHKVRNVRQTHQNVMDESDSHRYGRDSPLNEPVRHFVEQEGKKDSQITTTLHSVNENAQSGDNGSIVDASSNEEKTPNASGFASGISKLTNLTNASITTVSESKAAANEANLLATTAITDAQTTTASKSNVPLNETRNESLPVSSSTYQPNEVELPTTDNITSTVHVTKTSDITLNSTKSNTSETTSVATMNITTTYSLTTTELTTSKIGEEETQKEPKEDELRRVKPPANESDDTMLWAVIVAIIAMLMFIYLACGFCIMCKTIKEMQKDEALAIKQAAIA